MRSSAKAFGCCAAAGVAIPSAAALAIAGRPAVALGLGVAGLVAYRLGALVEGRRFTPASFRSFQGNLVGAAAGVPATLAIADSGAAAMVAGIGAVVWSVLFVGLADELS